MLEEERNKQDFMMSGGTNTNNETPSEESNTDDEYANYIPLTSLGVSYIGVNNLKEEIKVRPLDWRDEDILTTQHYIDDSIVLDKILDAVILDSSLKRPMLTQIDKETILYWLRSQEFGPIVKIIQTCPICNHRNHIEWNLEEIDIPKYEPEILDELINRTGELLIETPVTKVKILLKIATVAEIDVFKKRITKDKRANNPSSDKLSTEIMNLMISGVVLFNETSQKDEVIRDKKKIFAHFDKVKLKLKELRFIREQYERINLSYKTEKNVTCESCNYIQEGVELPTNHKSFFWPDN